MSYHSVPSLSTHGWIHDAAPMFDYLFSQFVLAQQSQTNAYKGHIASLSGIVQQYQNDMPACATAIERTLLNYFSRYYTDVSITVTHNLSEPETSNVKTNFTIRLNFTHKGVRHDASRLLQRDGNTFKEISKVNNG